jgi:hypothetical protein
MNHINKNNQILHNSNINLLKKKYLIKNLNILVNRTIIIKKNLYKNNL